MKCTWYLVLGKETLCTGLSNTIIHIFRRRNLLGYFGRVPSSVKYITLHPSHPQDMYREPIHSCGLFDPTLFASLGRNHDTHPHYDQHGCYWVPCSLQRALSGWAHWDRRLDGSIVIGRSVKTKRPRLINRVKIITVSPDEVLTFD